MKAFKFLFIFSFLILINACATVPKYQVQVNSLVSINYNRHLQQNYILKPANRAISIEDLQFQEFAKITEFYLKLKNLNRVYKEKDAQMQIFLDYRVSQPETIQRTYSQPVYSHVGGYYRPHRVYDHKTNSYRNHRPYYQPQYQIVGYNQHVENYTVFTRYLKLSAQKLIIKNKKVEVGEELWQISAYSTGNSSDLRKIFPIMMQATAPYITLNTGQTIELSIAESTESIY